MVLLIHKVFKTEQQYAIIGREAHIVCFQFYYFLCSTSWSTLRSLFRCRVLLLLLLPVLYLLLILPLLCRYLVSCLWKHLKKTVQSA